MATREQLEAQIAAAPLDETSYAVYADWLQQHGDPRGELIALDLAAQRDPRDFTWRTRRAELLARHPELVPPVESNVTYEWFCGFVRRVAIAVHREFPAFDHPAFAFVREVALPVTWKAKELVAAAFARFPRLRRIAIGESGGVYGGGTQGRASLDGIATLEELSIPVPFSIAEAPRLRVLELSGSHADDLRWLEDAKLPALERLSIWFASNASIEVHHVQPLFATSPPTLRRLELYNLPLGDALVTTLVNSPVVRRLDVLGIWNLGLTRAGAARFTPEVFGHLELLDLTDAGLDDESIRLLERACSHVRTVPRRVRERLRRD